MSASDASLRSLGVTGPPDIVHHLTTLRSSVNRYVRSFELRMKLIGDADQQFVVMSPQCPAITLPTVPMKSTVVRSSPCGPLRFETLRPPLARG